MDDGVGGGILSAAFLNMRTIVSFSMQGKVRRGERDKGAVTDHPCFGDRTAKYLEGVIVVATIDSWFCWKCAQLAWD